MKERAYAKINLCLDVVGKRDDGYHDLKMIMVPINFYDVLEMEFAKQTTLELNRDYLPINDKKYNYQSDSYHAGKVYSQRRVSLSFGETYSYKSWSCGW